MASVTSLGVHTPSGKPFLESVIGEVHYENARQAVSDNDELFITPTSVTWSEGGITRRTYSFNIENEPVTSAVLARFGTTKKQRALVVLLRTQAHVHFLSGSSHIVHLPFEVDHVFAAPNGVLLQRKLPSGSGLFLPPAPPNSFVSGSTSFRLASSFSPGRGVTKDLPRLFCLSDPLEELGLVVTDNGYNGSLLSVSADEDILYVSPTSEEQSLAVTFNHDTRNCTVWQMTYITPEMTPKARSLAYARRRSSMAPHAPRESLPSKTMTLRPDPTRSDSTKIAAAFDPEFDDRPAKSTRRISSLVARADLSTNYEKAAFTDMASGTQSFKRGDSFSRSSFGGSMAHRAVSISQDPPVDDLLSQLTTNDELPGFNNPEEGLRKEIVFKAVETFSIDSTVNFLKRPKPKPTVFTMRMRRGIVVSVLENSTQTLLLLVIESAKPGKKLRVADQRKFTRILDASIITDDDISRILILSETESGPELSLVAPWSPTLKVDMPSGLNIFDQFALTPILSPLKKREIGFKRVFSGPRKPVALRCSGNDGTITVSDEDGKRHRITIQLKPKDPGVARALEVCRRVLPENGGETMLVIWWAVHRWIRGREDIVDGYEWKAFVIVIWLLSKDLLPQFSRITVRRKGGQLRSSSGAGSAQNWNEVVAIEGHQNFPGAAWALSPGWGWMTTEHPQNPLIVQSMTLSKEFAEAEANAASILPASKLYNFYSILIALHILREELKLDVSTSEFSSDAAQRLTPLLAQMSILLGWQSWHSRYLLEDATMQSWAFADIEFSETLPEPFAAPSIYDWIIARLGGISTPFTRLSDLTEEHVDDLTPKLDMIMRLFDFLRKKRRSAQEMVDYLTKHDIDLAAIDRLPEAILIPLREAIAICQHDTPAVWSSAALTLIGRDDLKLMLEPTTRGAPHRWHTNMSHDATRDVHSACVSTFETENLGAFDGSAELDRAAVTRLIFREDRRFNEAARLLQSTKPTMAKCMPHSSWSEADLFDAQKEIAQIVAIRTLAVSSGRGLLYYSARVPLLTEKFPISGFNLSCVMKPSNNTVSADKASFTEEKVCWAFFHAGVSAGLSISKEAKGIDTSWIVFNKPPELSNRHAGFLLALGLNGHLKTLAKWVSFKYLTPKHTMTSIGLLLGLAASHLGTMDTLVARLLSVHVTRMLPPGAAELNLSPLTQTSGIMGIGLLYCGTQHRRMSEIMLSEIEHVEEEEHLPLTGELRDEGYRLAAGFALGFINIGKGSDLRGLHDMHLVERLLSLAVGSKKISLVHILDKATAAATVAIALIYMKTHDEALARQIDIPDTVKQFDYVRPDIFLLRTVAKHLIMWNAMQPSFDWIKRNLPQPYRDRSKLSNVKMLDSEDLAMFNVVAGLCFSLALRYAGTNHSDTRHILIHYLDQFIRIASLPAMNYDQRLTLGTVRNCQDLVALACATVAAGSGDLDIFRRLRSLHGRTTGTSYGSFLAGHIAIGALFLGGGSHTFGTSDLAVGALLCAFYPLFPTSILDNKCHLQAFRHFWVLAVESRGVVPRDAETHRPLPLALSIRMRDGSILNRTAPCLLPEFGRIAALQTTSSEYSPIILDLVKNPGLFESFKKSLTIYLRRRTSESKSVFLTTVQTLSDTEAQSSPLDWIFAREAFARHNARAYVLSSDAYNTIESTALDIQLALERSATTVRAADRLRNVKLLLTWIDQLAMGERTRYITQETADELRAMIWTAFAN